MYAIRELDTHAWVQFASAGGVSTNTHRDRAQRFPTIEAARVVYRTLPRNRRFLIVPAEEDRK